MKKLRRAYRWASRTSAGVLDDLTLEGGMWIFIITALAVIAGLVWGALSGFVNGLVSALQNLS